MKDQPYPYSWTRDMPNPIAQSVVNSFAKDYHIIQVCRSQEQALLGVEVMHEQVSNMELLSLLLFSQKRVLIDSCLQHAAAALRLPSTVLWVGTSAETFGYAMHNNIQAKLPEKVKLPDSYLFDYSFHGTIHECPLFDLNIFDESEVLNSVNSI